MSSTLPNLVAFTGYADSGKDEAARPLIEMGRERYCFGDIIKRQLDMIVQDHFGFSAFTENGSQKERIRPVMESWGEANYDKIFDEYFTGLSVKPFAVNARLVRVREAVEWKRRGGVIVCITRPGQRAATVWEEDRLRELWEGKLIDTEIINAATVRLLHDNVLTRLRGLAR
jgi:hypothetical protein